MATVAAAAPWVPIARPDIGDEEVAEVVATLRSGWLSTGPRVQEFERRFAEYIGVPHAVAVNSCTAALHLSLLVLDVGPGDEVITSPLTFCATANAVIHTGATPVFADIEPGTMNLDPGATAAAVSPATRALLPVHFAGRPVRVDEFRTLALARGLHVIHDAAHCVEGSIHGQKIGAAADLTCFSFYSTKNLTTGEGGMVTTDREDWARRIRVAALHGMSKDAWARYSRTGSSHYDVVTAGFKYNMMDLQAALGLHQLQRLPRMLAHRETLWRFYDEALADLPLTRPVAPEADTVHARHLYTVLVDEQACGLTRDALQAALQQRGIGTGIHFKALHLHPYYSERYNLRRGMFPHAEYVSDRTLSLPFSAATSLDEAEQVAAVLRELVG